MKGGNHAHMCNLGDILDKCPNGCNADWKIKSSNT